MKTRRRYTLRKRAESRDATRARIIAATMALHEERGPKNTTISAVADRAGVQRLTVYRHFPDETALFKACTSQWLADHPPPDAAAWRGIADDGDRLRSALGALYRYYRGTERMWSAACRDEHEVRALRRPMRQFRTSIDRMADELAASLQRGGVGGDNLVLTLRHALQFETWRSLAMRGAGDDAIADLVVGWVMGGTTQPDKR